jgi:hypothetical protein
LTAKQRTNLGGRGKSVGKKREKGFKIESEEK